MIMGKTYGCLEKQMETLLNKPFNIRYGVVGVSVLTAFK